MDTQDEMFDRYWDAVSARVCVKCIDGDGYGNCRLGGFHTCGLRAHFPKIVETVVSTHSDQIEPYIAALRENVCAFCTYQSADGKCRFRTDLDCGLDRYFPLIVEAIEGVHAHASR